MKKARTIITAEIKSIVTASSVDTGILRCRRDRRSLTGESPAECSKVEGHYKSEGKNKSFRAKSLENYNDYGLHADMLADCLKALHQ